MGDASFGEDHPRDSLGPRGATQLYVRTDIEVHEDAVMTKGKMVRRGDRQIKDASEEQLTKMRRKMQTGFEEMGGEDFRATRHRQGDLFDPRMLLVWGRLVSKMLRCIPDVFTVRNFLRPGGRHIVVHG